MHRQIAKQRGMALAIALILLVVVTLIGLAAVRSTTSQQKMTANFYDRELAFQNAEAALRVGALAIRAGGINIRNCGQGGVPCRANPFADPNLNVTFINTVIGQGAGMQYTKGANVATQPQYVVENMGLFANPQLNNGFDQTANSAQYGAQGTALQTINYRVTARSGNPADVGERAVVVLQAMYR